MSKTAVFYSPEGGSVDRVANNLGKVLGNDNVDIIPVVKVEEGDLKNYNQFILVGSTVGADHWRNETIVDEWQGLFSKIPDDAFEGKKVAIIGLGNSVLYPEHFADGIALLYNEVTKRKAKVFGFTDAEGYTFEDSEALNDEGMFCGLPLDEDNEDELTEERLEEWITALMPDFGFH